MTDEDTRLLRPTKNDLLEEQVRAMQQAAKEPPVSEQLEEELRQQGSRTEFWMKIAGISFGLWSVAIGYAIKSVGDFQSQFSNYVLVTERRVTLLEERQMAVLKALEKVDRDHDALMPRVEPRAR